MFYLFKPKEWRRYLLGCALTSAGIVLMPEGPWWQEIGTLLLITSGTLYAAEGFRGIRI